MINSVPITILKRPTPPARQQPPPPPPVKILINPNRQAATAHSIQTPSSQNASPPVPPPVKILMNPRRQAATAHTIQTPSPQNAPPAPIPALKARSAAHISFAEVVPADYSPHRRSGGRATPSVPRTGFRPELMVRLPKVIIHEPVWWDHWTDVHHPGTSHGRMLHVPPVNWRGKLDTDDLVRYYPKERSAEQTMRRLARARTGRRSATRRHACSCQKAEKARSQATPATPPRSASASSPTSLPHSIYFL